MSSREAFEAWCVHHPQLLLPDHIAGNLCWRAWQAATEKAEVERDCYKAGNTELLEALMRYAEGQESAAAFAQDVLGRAGMLNGGDGTLNWLALEDRKPKQQTWEQAVNECITDPEERARLLEMADDAAAIRGTIDAALAAEGKT